MEDPVHPCSDLLATFQPNPWQLDERAPIRFKHIDIRPTVLVDTVDGLHKLLAKLRPLPEIVVHVGFSSAYCFKGAVACIQISTRTEDFLVDAFALQNELYILKDVFMDPKVLKVIPFGAWNGLKALQRDHDIFFVNIFNVDLADKVVKQKGVRISNEHQRTPLADLIAEYCGEDVALTLSSRQKRHLPDLTTRPFNKNAKRYLQEETHYILFIHDCLRNGMIYNGLIRQYYDVCTERLANEIWNPNDHILQEDTYKKALAEKISWFNEMELEVYRRIHDWRWEVAERNDVGMVCVMSKNHLIDITKRLPETLNDIRACKRGPHVSEYIEKGADDIISMIQETRAKYPDVQKRQIIRSSEFTGHGGQSSGRGDFVMKLCDRCGNKGHYGEQCWTFPTWNNDAIKQEFQNQDNFKTQEGKEKIVRTMLKYLMELEEDGQPRWQRQQQIMSGDFTHNRYGDPRQTTARQQQQHFLQMENVLRNIKPITAQLDQMGVFEMGEMEIMQKMGQLTQMGQMGQASYQDQMEDMGYQGQEGGPSRHVGHYQGERYQPY